MSRLTCLPDENVLHSTTSGGCLCGEEETCCCWLGLSWTIHLTNRRIVTRVAKKLFGVTFYERIESFRYKDLKHVSVSRNTTYWKQFFGLSTLEFAIIMIDLIMYLTGRNDGNSLNGLEISSNHNLVAEEDSFADSQGTSAFHHFYGDIFTDPADDDVSAEGEEEDFFGAANTRSNDPSFIDDDGLSVLTKVWVVLMLIITAINLFLAFVLFSIGFVESFCFKALALDFYKKERVESWLFTVFDGRFGSATTKHMRFPSHQCHEIAKALHEHRKTQLSESPPPNPPSNT